MSVLARLAYQPIIFLSLPIPPTFSISHPIISSRLNLSQPPNLPRKPISIPREPTEKSSRRTETATTEPKRKRLKDRKLSPVLALVGPFDSPGPETSTWSPAQAGGPGSARSLLTVCTHCTRSLVCTLELFSVPGTWQSRKRCHWSALQEDVWTYRSTGGIARAAWVSEGTAEVHTWSTVSGETRMRAAQGFCMMSWRVLFVLLGVGARFGLREGCGRGCGC